MPQFDPATFSPQLVWLLITFVVFFLLMARVGLPSVEQVLTRREERIADDLDNAKRMNEEAEAVRAKHESDLAKAKASAQTIIAEGNEAVNDRISEAQNALNTKLSARLEEAEKRVEAATAEAMKEVEGVATEVATSIVGQLAGGTDKDVAAAVKANMDNKGA